MKWVIVLTFVLIIGALGSAGVMMLRRKPGDASLDKRMARALAVRIGVSVLLFAFVLLAHWFGWIQPTGLRAGQ